MVFSSDCENDRHEYYWNKVETPYLYVKVELLDGVGHEGAKQIVSMLKYDKDHKTDKERNMVNFSIEGAKLDKEGMVVKRCIGRDVAITIKPCLKVCVAEEFEEGIEKTEDSMCEIMRKGEYDDDIDSSGKPDEKIKIEGLVKAKIDKIKYPEGSKGAASKKKVDRKERNSDYQPNKRSGKKRTSVIFYF